MDFRERLTRLRLDRGLTQASLAEKMDVSLDTVVQWENGDGEPPLKELLPLAEALGVNVEALLSGGEPDPSRASGFQEETDSAEEVLCCPCCGRKIRGSLCLTCEFPITGYQDKGPRYAVLLKNWSGENYNEERAESLYKYCGLDREAAAPFLERGSQLVARRGLTDVAAHWIASRINPECFGLKIVEDCGEPDAGLLEKPQVMERPAYVFKKDDGIGIGGVILIVILTLIVLSFV